MEVIERNKLLNETKQNWVKFKLLDEFIINDSKQITIQGQIQGCLIHA